MPKATLYPRHIKPLLGEALKDSPAVLIHGPRQCGKTTLARGEVLALKDRQGHWLVHEDEDYEEWGASLALKLDPGARGRGLSFSLLPT